MSFPLEEVLEEIADSTRPRFDVRELPSRERLTKTKRDPVERFMSRVDKSAGPDGCWIWSGSKRFHVDRPKGRGSDIAIEFRRYAWMQANPGKKPPRFLFASCRNRKCCNPRHLTTKHPGHLTRAQAMYGPNPKATPLRVVTEEPVRSPAAALTNIITILDELDGDARARVLAAVRAFYNPGESS